MTPRVHKYVYCAEKYEAEIQKELTKLYGRLSDEHPEWEFDYDQDWEEG